VYTRQVKWVVLNYDVKHPSLRLNVPNLTEISFMSSVWSYTLRRIKHAKIVFVISSTKLVIVRKFDTCYPE